MGCTPSVHSFTTTSAKAWRRVSSARLVRISRPWRRTTRRSASRRRKARVRRKGTVMSSEKLASTPNLLLLLTLYARERLAHVFLQVFEFREVAGVARSIFRCLDE